MDEDSRAADLKASRKLAGGGADVVGIFFSLFRAP